MKSKKGPIEIKKPVNERLLSWEARKTWNDLDKCVKFALTEMAQERLQGTSTDDRVREILRLVRLKIRSIHVTVNSDGLALSEDELLGTDLCLRLLKMKFPDLFFPATLLKEGIHSVDPVMADRWEINLIHFVGFFLPKHHREEWIGDLQESVNELVKKGYARWTISIIALGRIFLLGWSLLRIRYSDLFSHKISKKIE